jgi:hypothetical protein
VVKEVLRWLLAPITTEQKHGVLQPTPLNGNLVPRFEIKEYGKRFTHEFDLQGSRGTWCLEIAQSPM